MRYCTNCGSELKNERFCSNCGTDNGDAINNGKQNSDIQSGSGTITPINIPTLLHWTAIILITLLSGNLFFRCCSSADEIIANLMLYPGSILLIIGYFVLGMWFVYPTILFILNGRNSNDNKGPIGLAIVIMLIILVLWIAWKILCPTGYYISGEVSPVVIALAPYRAKLSSVMTLGILTVIAGVFGTKFEQ